MASADGRRTRAGEPLALRALGTSALAIGAAASLGAALVPARSSTPRGRKAPANQREVQGLYTAAGLLAASVFLDSAVEHYRGGYRNPGMITPLVTSAVTAAAAACDAAGPRRVTGAAYWTALAVGLSGLGFHVFNIAKRPGRLNWANLFYAAPVGAPAALSLAGVLGLAAGAVARGARRAGRRLCALTALALAGTVGEAGLLHFRGAFQNPFMWLPVTLPPVSAALLAKTAGSEENGLRQITRAWLALTAALGIAGVGFHMFGVSRAMGGWRNWRQNLIDGPPIPAPPAFTALSIAGLSALALREAEAA
jgi:hypothetical protein